MTVVESIEAIRKPEKATLMVNGVYQDFITMDGTRMKVLKDIRLSFEDKVFVAFIGRSGCGKSTLLRIICGLQTPTRGAVTFRGKKVGGPSADRGMVFQQDAVFPWLTVRQNIEFGLRVRNLSKKEIRERAEQWIRLVGLDGWEEAFPKELSGGMRKRVDLARVYANAPDLMLMDEPFGALDQQTKSVMQGELQELWSKAKSMVLFVTHDLEEALFLSDKIVVLSPRPGVVKDIMNVDLPRPRHEDIRLSSEFLERKRQLHELLKE